MTTTQMTSKRLMLFLLTLLLFFSSAFSQTNSSASGLFPLTSLCVCLVVCVTNEIRLNHHLNIIYEFMNTNIHIIISKHQGFNSRHNSLFVLYNCPSVSSFNPF